MANTLEAVKSGASVVDSTLQGMGRSAGNTQTEILIMVLEQSGYSVGVDAYKAFDLGQRVIKPMMNRDQGLDDMSIISGIAQFHSSFFEIIKKMSKKYRIDPRLLILEVSKVNRVNVTEEIAEETAKRIKKNIVSEPDRNNKAIMLEFVKSKKSNNSLVQAKMIFDQLISQSRKTGKESVFSLTLSQNGKTVFPFIRQSKSLIIANCEAKDLAELTKIADLADGRVNWILFDGSVPDVKEQSINIKLKKSRTTYYYEKRAISLSVSTHIAQNPPKGKILLFAGYNDALYLKSLLQQIGIIDVLHMNDKEKTKERILKSLMLETGAIISFDKKYTDDLNETHSELLSPEVRIYIVKPGAFNNLFWNAAMSRGLSLFRIDTRVGLASEVYLSIETKKLLEDMGTCEIEGIPVVSGGVIGPKGTVVVDSKTTPARIIGVADGLGGLLSDECEYEEKKDRLQAILIEKLYERTF